MPERPLPPLPDDDLDAIAASSAVPWEKLRGARIFLTGGTGFFGTWLVESFLRANERFSLGARLVVLSRDPKRTLARLPHLDSSALEWLAGDVRSFQFPEGSFTHAILGATAASAKLNAESPLEMFDTIVEGTRRSLEFCAAAGAPRTLFISSGAVYGTQPPDLSHVPETQRTGPDPLDVNAAYANGKHAAEHLCRLFATARGLPFVVARAFAFVGPHLPLDAHFAIGNFLRDALLGREIHVAGDGTPFRSYQYARDLAIWLWALLLRGEPGRAYNVGSDRAVSISELASLVSRTVGSGAFRIAGEPRPGVKPPRYVPSCERARSELGLTETVGLEEAVLRTAAWVRRAGILEKTA